MTVTLPSIMSSGTVPQTRESLLCSRLSPTTSARRRPGPLAARSQLAREPVVGAAQPVGEGDARLVAERRARGLDVGE